MKRTAFVLCSSLAMMFVAPAASVALDRYVQANPSTYDTLDPHTVNDTGRVASRLNFYDGLYRWVDNPPQMIPWLARDHTVSEDGLTWTFNLRDDVIFHDGTPMTAHDVVYSLERILTLKRGVASLFTPLIDPGNTEAVDEHKVEFTLKEPSAIFGSMVPSIYVLNSALVKDNEIDGDMGQAYLIDHIAGSGSYSLKRYDPVRGFIGERFVEHFAGWGDKFFDEIEFRTVMEVNTRIQGLKRGDFQGLDGSLSHDQITRLKTDKNVQILEEESMRVMHFTIHNGRAPLDDLNFRRAMAHAYDYDGHINDLMGGSVARNPTIIPANLWGAPEVPGYVFDLEKAKEYLDAYKAEHGEEIRTLKIAALAGFSESEQAAALLQNGLAKLGISAQVENTPWAVLESKMNDPETLPDMVAYFKSTYYADPHNWIGEQYGSRYAPTRNVSDYHNPTVDEMVEKALVITDQGERAKLYEAAATQVYEDAAGIFVSNAKWFGPYAENVRNVRFCPVGNGQDMRWAHLKD